MATPDDPFRKFNVTAFFHFTDASNVPLIKKHGGLYSLDELRKRKIEVPRPGGNQWSHDADGYKGLDKYVHLCFRVNHPMEFIARQEQRIVQTAFLEIHRDVLDIPGVRYTPDVSNKREVPIHSLDEAKAMIDFEVLYTRTNWSDPAIQLRLRAAEKAELLVPDHIPLRLIKVLPHG